MPTRHVVTVDSDQEVVAVHHPAPSDEWLVWCHGLLSDKSGGYESRSRRAIEEGYNAVRFDCRGCGESDGPFVASTLRSRIADLRAVLDHFDARFEVGTYVLFGSSFGAKVALHAAVGDDRVRRVAGRAPVTFNRAFDDVRAVVDETGAFQYDTGDTIDRRFFDALDDYPFEAVTSRIDVHVALFHGRADETVPLDDSLAATGALDTDVTLRAFAGEGHVFSESAERRMRRGLFDWLAAD
jgi:pimeloyl-ACP methyl ester carboxylesterase